MRVFPERLSGLERFEAFIPLTWRVGEVILPLPLVVFPAIRRLNDPLSFPV